MAIKKKYKLFLGASIFIFCLLTLIYTAMMKFLLLCICLGITGIVFVLLYFCICHCKYEKREMANVIPEGKKLLVVVPHPDDELNVAAVLMRNVLIRQGEVYIVYTTNFDVYGEKNANRRLSEIRKLCKKLSIPNENIFYAGYHAALHEEYGIKKSIEYTYALDKEKTCAMKLYGKEVLQTFEHLEKIIYDMIVQIKPDIICGVDYDSHADHRMASDALEKAVNWFREKNKSYRPLILKGFSYTTSWMSVPDFYENDEYLRASVSNRNNSSVISRYDWETRIRLPYINSADLGHTLRSSYLYKLYASYMSQNALSHMNQIVNGDQVFWELGDSDAGIPPVSETKISYCKISIFPDMEFLYELFCKPDKNYKLCILNENNRIEKNTVLHLYLLQKGKEKELYGMDGIYTIVLNRGKACIVCRKDGEVIDAISVYSSKSVKFLESFILKKSEWLLDWFLKRFRTNLYSFKIKVYRKRLCASRW